MVAQQADALARAWSPPSAPSSWRLTAAIFATLRDQPELLALTTEIPADRLPPLLFSAATTFLVRRLDPEPLGRSYPVAGAPQRDLDWLSLDPLVPLGPRARRSVLEVDVPAAVLQRGREGGVFGVLSHQAVRDGRSQASLLALGHPSGAWLEWLSDAG